MLMRNLRLRIMVLMRESVLSRLMFVKGLGLLF